jgi:hypothetical protein
MIPPAPTQFATKNVLIILATQKLLGLSIVRFASPEGVVEFARAITMVEAWYYRKLSPRNVV